MVAPIRVALTVALLCGSFFASPSNAQAPTGFGSGVIGGAGGEKVRVSTPADLTKALCGTFSGSQCVDNTPRIIEIATVIDFTGTEGKKTEAGCYYSSCSDPKNNERLIDPRSTHCSGRVALDITYDAAGTNPLKVGSNKSIIGIGANAGIKGKGLTLRGGNSNIIIQNLAITDINYGIVFAGDAITMDDTSRVWIDHNYIARIGRQFIVSGYGQANSVTISNNIFDGTSQYSSYCNGKHYWNMLLLGKTDTITISGNWIKNFSGRAPKIGTETATSSIVHIVNNLFEGGSWHAIDHTSPAKILIEGNYFKDVDTPVMPGTGNVYGQINAFSSSDSSACLSATKRNCIPNAVSSALDSKKNNFKNQEAVLSAVSPLTKYLVQPYSADLVAKTVQANAGPKASLAPPSLTASVKYRTILSVGNTFAAALIFTPNRAITSWSATIALGTHTLDKVMKAHYSKGSGNTVKISNASNNGAVAADTAYTIRYNCILATGTTPSGPTSVTLVLNGISMNLPVISALQTEGTAFDEEDPLHEGDENFDDESYEVPSEVLPETPSETLPETPSEALPETPSGATTLFQPIAILVTCLVSLIHFVI